jgi:hypothetical protein
MYRHIRHCERIHIFSMSTPHFIKSRPLDVRIHRENRIVSLRSAEKQEIRSGTELVAVLLKETPCPDMTVAQAGVVEGGDARDAAEEGPGLAGEGMEGEVIESGEDELVGDVSFDVRSEIWECVDLRSRRTRRRELGVKNPL